MPTIGNNARTLLHGLSDFWTRFYADIEELEAMYQATEIVLAQAYLDMLSSFLNISIQDAPLFNTELFKLITVREDQLIFDEGAIDEQSRHVYTMPDAVVEAHILQNKVYDPTASLELGDYDVDADDYALRFKSDVSGAPGTVLDTTTEGSLLTYGTGQLTRLYVDEGAPFAKAKEGYWVQIQASGSDNNKTFKVGGLIDDQAILLQGDFNLPETNNGSLICTLLDSEFTPIEGFAHRIVTVNLGGTFDDFQRRRTTEIESWYAEQPQGVGIRKGDILRVLDEESVPTVPTDFVIDLVRHDKLYMAAETPISEDAGWVKKYVILREPPDPDYDEDVWFAQVNQDKTNNDGSLFAHADGTELFTTVSTFAQTDRQRYVTIQNSGPIQWTADLDTDGTLTWKPASTIQNPLVRAHATGSIELIGTTGQDGDYAIAEIIDDQTVRLDGEFTSELNITARLVGVTNDGTYLIRKVPAGDSLTFATKLAVPDLNNPSLIWEIHDGYKASLTKTRIKRGSVEMYRAIGSQATGGVRNVEKDVDVVVEHESGTLTQVGPLAGTWGINITLPPLQVMYQWYREVIAESEQVDSDIPGVATDTINATTRVITFNQVNVETALSSTTGFNASAHTNALLRITGSSDALNNQDYQIEEVINSYTVKVYEAPNSSVTEDFMAEGDGVYTLGTTGELDADATEEQVNEIAFWAPDVKVDKFHLYNNYGYLIERFQPSSESYREFIRGVFQLYMLGPTLEHMESALNVISGFPVIRDDDEILIAYDDLSSTTVNTVETERFDGTRAFYEFPKAVPIRSDITSYIPGTSDELTFHAFEPLTTMFHVTDYIEDPTWWENIIIPSYVMPSESTWRRTTLPILYEHNIGQVDEPHIGDPGLFIGADDEGVVPAAGVNPLRRKMANVVMERFLRFHMFYVYFDAQTSSVLSSDFVTDLQELILIAKPSHKLLYIEPATNFTDTMRVLEDLKIHVRLFLFEYGPDIGEQTLTIQGHSWNIGDVHRLEAAQTGIALVTADGVSVPGPIILSKDHVISKHVHLPGGAASGDEVIEFRDYVMNYKTGILRPLSIWPAGDYTIDFRSVLISPAASKDASLGDTDYCIGAPDPESIWYKRMWSHGGTISTVNGDKRLTDDNAVFTDALHREKRIIVMNSSAQFWFPRIIRTSPVILSDPTIPDGTVSWMPLVDEDTEGVITESGGHVYLETSRGFFFSDAVMGRYVYVESSLNSGHPYKIIDVISPNKVELEQPSSPHGFGGSPPPDVVADTDVYWQLRGSPDQMDLIERPLQIAIS